MKILLVNTLYPPHDVGGAERSVALLAAGLARAGTAVSVLTLADGPATVDEVVDGIAVRRLPLQNLYWPYGGDRPGPLMRGLWHGMEAVGGGMDAAVARTVRDLQPDIVHAHVMTGFGQAVFRAARRQRLPLVTTLRDYSLMCARASMFRSSRRCERRCHDCALLTRGKATASIRTDHVVSISNALLQTHRDHGLFRHTPGTVIGNAAASARIVRRPPLTDQPEINFGFLGRLEPAKGVDVLLEATRRLHGPWRLRIGGRGDPAYVEGLRRRFDDPRLTWLGQTDSSEFYRDVDVVVAPALWAEPFGRVVVEAAAHGRAVIASRIGGLPEAAACARLAVLVEAGDADALALTMQDAILNPVHWRFGAERPREPVWTEAAIAEAHMALYRQVLAASASRIPADRSQR